MVVFCQNRNKQIVFILVGNGNGMQYFGAILIKSDLSPEELDAYYQEFRTGQFDCLVEAQLSSDILPIEGGDLAFQHTEYGVGYYIVYTWGDAPDWLETWLDTDLRGHYRSKKWNVKNSAHDWALF